MGSNEPTYGGANVSTDCSTYMDPNFDSVDSALQ